MWFGVGLQLGTEVKFLVTSEFLSLLGLEFIKLFLNVLEPCRQVVNESQPFFFLFPEPEGLARVAESLCPARLLSQFVQGCFLIVVEQGTTVSGYSWFQRNTDPTKYYHRMSVLNVLYCFIK